MDDSDRNRKVDDLIDFEHRKYRVEVSNGYGKMAFWAVIVFFIGVHFCANGGFGWFIGLPIAFFSGLFGVFCAYYMIRG